MGEVSIMTNSYNSYPNIYLIIYVLPNAHRKDAVYKIVLTIVMANAKS